MNYLDITKIESSQLQDIDRLVALKDDEVKIIDKESITTDIDSKIETHNSDNNSHKELFDSAYEAIDTVADKLDTESTTRANKDTELANSISSLDGSLKSETEARVSKDTELTNLLANESTSRMEDISSLNKALAAETEARTSKDTEIAAKIDGLNIKNGFGTGSIKGANCVATNVNSFAFGNYCYARGAHSFATGVATYANNFASHSEGLSTETSTQAGHCQGQYNEDDTDLMDSVGIGYAPIDGSNYVRKNAEATYLDGRKYIINVGGYDGTKASIASGAKDVATVAGEATAHIASTDNPHKVTASQIGASTPAEVTSAIATHNTATDSHSDIRDLVNSQIAVFDFALPSYPGTGLIQFTVNRASVLAAKTANKLVLFRFIIGEDYNYMFPMIDSVGNSNGVFIYDNTYCKLYPSGDSDTHNLVSQEMAVTTED